MKQKDIATIAVFAIIAAVVSFIVANMVFKPPKGSTQVPAVAAIDSSFPDTHNDSSYSSIFNEKALDPTQPVQIGNQNNDVPFR
jgi:hypothetical protein